jgi:hypothetical protein
MNYYLFIFLSYYNFLNNNQNRKINFINIQQSKNDIFLINSSNYYVFLFIFLSQFLIYLNYYYLILQMTFMNSILMIFALNSNISK